VPVSFVVFVFLSRLVFGERESAENANEKQNKQNSKKTPTLSSPLPSENP
jgi:hypothetical protein